MDIVPQLIVNSLIAGALYALIALGFNLIFSTVKFFDLGFGILAPIGAYTVFYLSRELHLSLFIAIPLGVIGASLSAFLIYKLVYTPLRARKASNMVMLVASLGVFTALQAVIAILFSSQFQTLSTTYLVFSIGDASITLVQLVLIGTAILSSIALAFFLRFTLFGKAIQAIGDDEDVATIVGVPTKKIIGGVFCIAGVLAAFAGILVGFDTGIEPTMGLNLLLKGVIASIIGGIGTLWGALAGGFLLGFVENFGIWKFAGEWKDAIAFAVLIIFLLFKPSGIFKK